MRRAVLSALAMSMAVALPARAALAPAALQDLAAAPPPGARVDLQARFVDQAGRRQTLAQAMDGRPSLLVFSDYTCNHLCGPALVIAAAALDRSGLAARQDYSFISLGLDPKDGPAEARALAAERFSPRSPAGAAAVLLSGEGDATARQARALGYRYVYDPKSDQFAHPAAAYVLASDGRVVRLLSELQLTGPDVASALGDARQGRVQAVVHAIGALCYGLSPAGGLFNRPVQILLALGAAATLAGLAGFLLAAARRERRS